MSMYPVPQEGDSVLSTEKKREFHVEGFRRVFWMGLEGWQDLRWSCRPRAHHGAGNAFSR